MKILILILLGAVIDSTLWAQKSQSNLIPIKETVVHDPVMIKQDSTY